MPAPRGPRPAALSLSDAERHALEKFVQRHSTPQLLALRARIILAAAHGKRNAQIARELSASVDMVRDWRARWLALTQVPLDELPVQARLADRERSGAPVRITAEQWCQITALVCEVPENSQRPISHWTPREIADEAIQRGIVDRISPRHLGRFLKGERSPAASVSLLADPVAYRARQRTGRQDR
jgi:putative transposase